MRLLPLAFVVSGLTACTTTPVAPIPPPLPETLAWAAEPDADGGAFLGLKTRENVGRSFENLDTASGVRVARVVENSPAAEAGFQVGDVVLSFGGHETNDPGTLEALVARATADERVELEVQRGDTVFTVPVELGEQADSAAGEAEVAYRLDPARSRAGWCTGRGGVVLVSSDPDGPFPRAGISVQSTVRAVDGEEVFSDRALIRKLQTYPPGAKVEVEYLDPAGESGRTDVRLQDQETRVTRFKLPILLNYDADTEGEESSFTLLDLWLVWLFHYERQGEERRWSILRFIRFETGVGELAE